MLRNYLQIFRISDLNTRKSYRIAHRQYSTTNEKVYTHIVEVSITHLWVRGFVVYGKGVTQLLLNPREIYKRLFYLR